MPLRTKIPPLLHSCSDAKGALKHGSIFYPNCQRRTNMTRAEEAALNAYPDDRFVDTEYSSMCREFYEEGYEQAEKDTIERACEWLFAHLPILIDYYDEDIYKKADRSEFIKLFRTQMEEQ